MKQGLCIQGLAAGHLLCTLGAGLLPGMGPSQEARTVQLRKCTAESVKGLETSVYSPLGASRDGLQASSPPCDEPLPSPLPLLAFKPSLDPLPGAEHMWMSTYQCYRGGN